MGSDYFLDILEFLLEMYSLFEELKRSCLFYFWFIFNFQVVRKLCFISITFLFYFISITFCQPKR